MPKIFIFGTGMQAKVTASVILSNKNYEIAGFISEQNITEKIYGKKSIIQKDFLVNFKKANIVIAIGENFKRKKIFNKLRSKGYKFPNIIHKKSIISKSVTLGYGNIIMPGSIINNDVNIGNFNNINTGVIIEHDCKILSFCSISPGSVISGKCKINDEVFVGSNSTIIHNINIGSETVIGAGTVVLKDIKKNLCIVGHPSREIRKKKYYLKS
jgi:acetyltransferase EpsM